MSRGDSKWEFPPESDLTGKIVIDDTNNPYILNTKDNPQIIINNDSFKEEQNRLFDELTERVTKRLADNYNMMMDKVHNDKFFENVKRDETEKSVPLYQSQFEVFSTSHTLESKLYSSWTQYFYLKLNSNNKIFRLTFQVTPRNNVDCTLLVDIREGNSYNRIFTEQYNDFYEGVECDLFENVDIRNHLYLIEVVKNLELI